MLIRDYGWGQIFKRKSSLIEDTTHVAIRAGALICASGSFSGDTFCDCKLFSSKRISVLQYAELKMYPQLRCHAPCDMYPSNSMPRVSLVIIFDTVVNT